jgi:hypothetical protein
MLAVQVAVTVIVLVDAGLLVQTIRNGYTRSAGFDTAHSLFVSVDVGTPLDLSAVLPSGFSANTPSARRGEIDRLSAALLENRKRAAVRVVEALQVVEGVEVLAVGPAPIGPDRALGIAQPRAVAVDVRCVTFG